jgi:hypothetical protein
MNIVFYNQHQHGDILLSRQGVRWVIENSPNDVQFHYVHDKDPNSVFVHEKINHIKFDQKIHCVPMHVVENSLKSQGALKDSLWVSTWCGSIHGMQMLHAIEDGVVVERYLLPHPSGKYEIGLNKDLVLNFKCESMLWKQNIDQINNYFNLNFSTKKIPYPNEDDLVVKWNDKPKKLELINNIIDKNKFNVLICNGQVISQQRVNFQYEDYLKEIIVSNPDINFYFTNDVYLKYDNVININSFVPLPNLDEIEYLSKFCQIIFTSISGPGCAVINSEVVNDKNKTLIYVCRKRLGLVYDNLKCKYYQTEDFSKRNITSILNEAIINQK